MANIIDITVVDAYSSCDDKGISKHVFTIRNITEITVIVGFRFDVPDKLDVDCFSVRGLKQRSLDSGSFDQVVVERCIPEHLANGQYKYRLVAYDVDNINAPTDRSASVVTVVQRSAGKQLATESSQVGSVESSSAGIGKSAGYLSVFLALFQSSLTCSFSHFASFFKRGDSSTETTENSFSMSPKILKITLCTVAAYCALNLGLVAAGSDKSNITCTISNESCPKLNESLTGKFLLGLASRLANIGLVKEEIDESKCP